MRPRKFLLPETVSRSGHSLDRVGVRSRGLGFSENYEILKVRDKGETEMANDKVKCQCCGKMMVPRVVFSRGWYIGRGMRIGGGRPERNICPFCLSDHWDRAPRKSKNLILEKICFFAASILVIKLSLMASGVINKYFYGVDLSDSAISKSLASCLFITLLAYCYAFQDDEKNHFE